MLESYFGNGHVHMFLQNIYCPEISGPYPGRGTKACSPQTAAEIPFHYFWAPSLPAKLHVLDGYLLRWAPNTQESVIQYHKSVGTPIQAIDFSIL